MCRQQGQSIVMERDAQHHKVWGLILILYLLWVSGYISFLPC